MMTIKDTNDKRISIVENEKFRSEVMIQNGKIKSEIKNKKVSENFKVNPDGTITVEKIKD